MYLDSIIICLISLFVLYSVFGSWIGDAVLVTGNIDDIWSIECLLGYFNMYTVGIKIPKLN